MGKWVVASAWPYINSVPHLGTIIHLLSADVYHRFLSLMGEDVISVSGSDEHGTPIEVEARKRNIDPKILTDEAHKYIVELLRRLDINLSNYSRTESEYHKEFVRSFMLKLEENGYIYTKEQVLPYCTKDGIFLPDRFVEGTCPRCGFPRARGDQCDNCGTLLDPIDLINPRCVFCGTKPVYKETIHWFFDLRKTQDKLEKWLKSNPNLDDRVRKYSLSWIREGLKPRSITRDVKWGIKAPFKNAGDKTIYVWIEALLGYLSASKEVLEKKGRKFEEFWHDPETKTVYFIGKDNIPFHAVILPAMLIASGEPYPLPYSIPSTEYILYEGEKFSKSRRVGLWIDEALELIDNPDYWRYTLIRMRPEERDSNFSWSEFARIINSELNDDIGNFVHRVLSFIKRFFESRVPEPGNLDSVDEDYWKGINEDYIKYIDKMYSQKLKQASEHILRIARASNAYINRKEPWKQIKENPEDASTTIYLTSNTVALISLMLYPITPRSSKKIWRMLNLDKHYGEIENMRLSKHGAERLVKPGTEVGEIEVLYRKIPEEFIDNIDRRIKSVREKINSRRPEVLRF